MQCKTFSLQFIVLIWGRKEFQKLDMIHDVKTYFGFFVQLQLTPT